MADPMVVEQRRAFHRVFTRNQNEVFKYRIFNLSFHSTKTEREQLFASCILYHLLSYCRRAGKNDFLIPSQVQFSEAFPEIRLDFQNEVISGFANPDGDVGQLKHDTVMVLTYTDSVTAFNIKSAYDLDNDYTKQIRKLVRPFRVQPYSPVEFPTIPDFEFPTIPDFLALPVQEPQEYLLLDNEETEEEYERQTSLSLEYEEEDEDDELRQVEQASFEELTPFTPHIPEVVSDDQTFRSTIKRKLEEMESLFDTSEKTYQVQKIVKETARKAGLPVDSFELGETIKSNWKTSITSVLDEIRVTIDNHFKFPSTSIFCECAICKDYLENPHSLDCGHVYCFDCLENDSLEKTSPRNGKRTEWDSSQQVMCPLCKKNGYYRKIYV